MTNEQKVRQLRCVVKSILDCRERLDSQVTGLTELSRGSIESNLQAFEKTQEYLENSITTGGVV